MRYIKHVGIYVKDIIVEKNFYINCFGMIPVVSEIDDSGEMYDELCHKENSKVRITKLITEYGKKTGFGEMIELIQVISHNVEKSDRNLTDCGLSHISIQIENMEIILKKINDNQGSVMTKVYNLGHRKCCFVKDPEANVIELIE